MVMINEPQNIILQIIEWIQFCCYFVLFIYKHGPASNEMMSERSECMQIAHNLLLNCPLNCNHMTEYSTYQTTEIKLTKSELHIARFVGSKRRTIINYYINNYFIVHKHKLVDEFKLIWCFDDCLVTILFGCVVKLYKKTTIVSR